LPGRQLQENDEVVIGGGLPWIYLKSSSVAAFRGLQVSEPPLGNPKVDPGIRQFRIDGNGNAKLLAGAQWIPNPECLRPSVRVVECNRSEIGKWLEVPIGSRGTIAKLQNSVLTRRSKSRGHMFGGHHEVLLAGKTLRISHPEVVGRDAYLSS
jgi:hypothetical protein